MNHLAVRIPENLELDVARARDEALEIHRVVAKCGQRLAPRGVQQRLEIAVALGHPHALSAPAGRRLDQHGIAKRLGRRSEFGVGRAGRGLIPGHHRHARGPHEIPGGGLAAHGADRVRARADEDEAGPCHRFGENGVLGQKAVARVDRLDVGLAGGQHDRVDVEIRIAGGRRPDVVGGVGQAHVQRICVGIGVDRDRADALCLARPNHAAGDLTSIGDQDTGKHALARSKYIGPPHAL